MEIVIIYKIGKNTIVLLVYSKSETDASHTVCKNNIFERHLFVVRYILNKTTTKHICFYFFKLQNLKAPPVIFFCYHFQIIISVYL